MSLLMLLRNKRKGLRDAKNAEKNIERSLRLCVLRVELAGSPGFTCLPASDTACQSVSVGWVLPTIVAVGCAHPTPAFRRRSEEHTSELQSH